MNDKLSVLLERIQHLEHELRDEIGKKEAQFSYEIRDRKAHFTTAVAAQHRRLAKTIALNRSGGIFRTDRRKLRTPKKPPWLTQVLSGVLSLSSTAAGLSCGQILRRFFIQQPTNLPELPNQQLKDVVDAEKADQSPNQATVCPNQGRPVPLTFRACIRRAAACTDSSA